MKAHGEKQSLKTPPVLALPRDEGKLTVDTDACDKQIGCVLLQEKPHGTTKRIGYWSRSFHYTERRYEMTHRECFAVVWYLLL